ncbi:MAG: DNA mismatch repair protein MutS, partial [Myxococcota bacterium]
MARAAKKKSYTPVMQQYLAAKDAYPDAVLFFRLGDFYEMFFDDAMVVAERLGITQTFRGKDPNGAKIPMAGVPHHAASGYIARLLQQGQKVAICEQMADPSTVKGVVPREVVRVITPGLCLEEENLDAFADNYLVAITGSPLGLAAFELSTGDLRACTLEDDAAALAEVVRLGCREVLVGSDVATGLKDALSSFDGLSVRTLEGGSADEGVLHAMLGELEGKLPAESSVRSAAAMALAYAASSQPGVQLRVQRVGVYDRRSYLQLDEVAIRNLELVRTLGGEKKGSLLHAVDGTVTAMGARLLRRRLTQPLLDVAAIRRRHAQVEAFIQDGATREGALGALRDLPDLERLATRAAAGVASPRDLGAVRQALQTALEVQAMLQAAPSGVEAPLAALVDADFVRPILADLEATLSDEPPALVREGGVIRAGVSADLDEDRRLSEHAKDVLIEIEARERQRTGIASLKIRFNKVFGYFIEVTKSNLKSVPDEYVRKQTIANGERFITDELAELQDRIELADSRAKKLEAALF